MLNEVETVGIAGELFTGNVLNGGRFPAEGKGMKPPPGGGAAARPPPRGSSAGAPPRSNKGDREL